MSSFTEPLTVTKLGTRTWKVARPFRYYVGEEGSKNFIDVPEGYETDFASVPRIFWVLLPPDGKYTQAAVVHDWLYGKKGATLPTGYAFNRRASDKVFLEAMKVLGVSWIKRHTMYRSLRLFGWFAWKGKK